MNVGEIKTTIKNQVDDQSIDDNELLQWVKDADDAIQTWKPPVDKNQTFNWWDYLKDQKTYTSNGQTKYLLPENFRAFIELDIDNDSQPYKLISFANRKKYDDHAIYILGKYFFLVNTLDAGRSMTFTFVRFAEEISSNEDEPEIERIYHQAYVEYGKKQYYSKQGDTELEKMAEANFEGIMMKKWQDQEMINLSSAPDRMPVNSSSIV